MCVFGLAVVLIAVHAVEDDQMTVLLVNRTRAVDDWEVVAMTHLHKDVHHHCHGLYQQARDLSEVHS